MSGVPDEVTVGAQGETVPLMDVLGGRGFVTGKSGAGKSNTASVFAEELLDCGLSLCIIDTDGEYYGLKEEYELLHAGAGERCDVQVGPEHAGKLANLALGENVPVILDCSGYLEEEEARDTVTALSKQLFAREAEHRKPFLLLVEEVHEYLPQGRGLDEAGDALLRIAKRGRKRGLGLLGLSQRPAAVDKDFITQCDWLVWHRLTWKNDTDLVADLLGSDYAEIIEELDNGEAIMQADWNDDLQRLKFRRKRTFDAGATPGLEDVDRPSLQSVDEKIIAAFESDDPTPANTDAEELREELADKNDRIAELEARIEELEAEVTATAAAAAAEADANTNGDANADGNANADGDGDGDAGALANASSDGGTSGDAATVADDDAGGGTASAANVEIVETQTVDESTRAREKRAEAVDGDPVWELGQMTAHLARRGGRGITQSVKSIGSTLAPKRDDDGEDGAESDGDDATDDESAKRGSTRDALAPPGEDDE